MHPGDPVDAVHQLTGGGADVAFEALGLGRRSSRPSRCCATADGWSLSGSRRPGCRANRDHAGRAPQPPGRRLVRVACSKRRPATAILVERGLVSPTESVTRRYSLEQAPEAYEALDRREIVGRAIVTTG